MESNFITEFKRTGEYWFAETVGRCNINTVFDVGCNIGEWTLMSKALMPNAHFHTFEISPATYDKFIKSGIVNERVTPNSFGLAESTKEINFKYCPDMDYLNTTLVELSPGLMNNVYYRWVKSFAVTGDFYIESRDIPYVDLVKIDVEGMENLVLEGLRDSLQNKKIGCIQFEYGFANVISKHLLIDYYKMLAPYGFKIAKLNDDSGLKFIDYNLTMENFYIPNYVAVHETRTDLLEQLSVRT